MLLGQELLKLHHHHSHSAKSRSKDVTIRVRMKGDSPEEHAAAIISYYGLNKTDEDTFKAKYGYDLRQNFIDSFKTEHNRAAHKSVGRGYFEVSITLPKTLVEQIKSIKSPIIIESAKRKR